MKLVELIMLLKYLIVFCIIGLLILGCFWIIIWTMIGIML